MRENVGKTFYFFKKVSKILTLTGISQLKKAQMTCQMQMYGQVFCAFTFCCQKKTNPEDGNN